MTDDFTPYTPEQRRVCDYIQDYTKGLIGCGDDPVGFLIASHNLYRLHLLQALQDLHDMQAAVDDPDNQPATSEQIARMKLANGAETFTADEVRSILKAAFPVAE